MYTVSARLASKFSKPVFPDAAALADKTPAKAVKCGPCVCQIPLGANGHSLCLGCFDIRVNNASPGSRSIMRNLATVTAFVAAFAWPDVGSCAPISLDDPLQCNASPHAFIGGLIDNGLLEPQPFRVESNSINAFNPMRSVDLRAFGFRVFAIVGFEESDPLFRKGSGNRVSKSAYGAVVWGSTQKVQTAATAAHSSAIVHHVAPFVTAIFCDREP
jgi:hypothetical protein